MKRVTRHHVYATQKRHQALPGGHIFITRALLRKLKNEAQLAGRWPSASLFLSLLLRCCVPAAAQLMRCLAGVLGHEVGHVVHRYAIAQLPISHSCPLKAAFGVNVLTHRRCRADTARASKRKKT
jgi:predicted Zn-dependent protease